MFSGPTHDAAKESIVCLVNTKGRSVKCRPKQVPENLVVTSGIHGLGNSYVFLTTNVYEILFVLPSLLPKQSFVDVFEVYITKTLFIHSL